MTGFRPLFIFGVARSGTNLLARMTGAHPQAAVALDVLMPLFRALRNGLARDRADADLVGRFNPQAPFLDGYGDSDGPALLDIILDGDLNVPLTAEERAGIGPRIADRATLEEPDLAEALRRVDGRTVRDLFEAALRIVATGRGQGGAHWVGVKEVWVLDFLPALARAWPQARFLVIERDPRSILASLTAMAKRDPSQHAHHISYLRHWRKAAVLARHYERDANLAARIRRIAYEDLAARPEAVAGDIARFLDLPYDPHMLCLEDADRRPWLSNSSYGAETGISTRSIERWRDGLSPAAIATVEFMCGPEMGLTPYGGQSPAPTPGPDVLEYVLAADRMAGSWRSDAGDPQTDFGFELFRRQLLALPDGIAPPALIRRGFLFPWVYDAIRGSGQALQTR